MWARHRNPWSSVTRMVLGCALLPALWHHAWSAILLLVLALMTNPFWFPPKPESDHFLARAITGQMLWLRKASRLEMALVASYGSAILLAVAWAFWTHQLVLGLIVSIMFAVYKAAYLWFMASLPGQTLLEP